MKNSIVSKKEEQLNLGRQQLKLSEMEFSALCDKHNGILILYEEYGSDCFELNVQNEIQNGLEFYCKKWHVSELKLMEKIQNYSKEDLKKLISIIELFWASPDDLIDKLGDDIQDLQI